MKKVMILIFILAALLSASCSQGPKGSAKFTFKISYAVTETPIATSKFKVFAERAGERKEFDVVGSEAIITLPVGIWNFYSVEWNGSAPYTGAIRCGIAPAVELKSGTDALVDFAQTEANCGNIFFKPAFNNYCYEAPASTGPGAGLFRSGDGTVSAPYEICSVAQLNNIGSNFAITGISSAYYKLARDINFHAKFINIPDALPFTMIGDNSPTVTNSFTGTFDGQGYSIKGMTVSASSTDTGYNSHGFFRKIGSYASIKNLNFYVPEIETNCYSGSCSSFTYMGTVAGQVTGTSVVFDNIHIHYGRVRGGTSVGGLVGYVSGGLTITNSSFEEGDIYGMGSVGGILGGGTTTPGDPIQVFKTLSSGNIEYQCEGSCSSDNFGGLIGYLSSGSAPADIQESTSSMNIKGMGRVGGLVGQNMLSLSITDSYATGAIYSLGGVSGSPSLSYAGGLVADNGGTLTLTRAFFTMGKAVGQSTSPQGSSGILGAGTAPSSCIDVFTTSLHNSAVSLPSGCSVVSYTAIRDSANFTPFLIMAPLKWIMPDPGFDYPRLAWEKARPCEGAMAGTLSPSQDGSAINPYMICTREQFSLIGSGNNIGKNFVLLRDIDLSTQLSTSYFPTVFTGTLNGNFKTIYGLNIYANASAAKVGLFNEIGATGTIKNLAIIMPDISGNGPITQVGAVAGINAGTITNTHITMAKITGESYVGGITGVNNGTISYSKNQGKITATGTRLGGIAGENSGTITRSRSDTMDITLVAGNNQFGGLVGYNYPNGVISESETYMYISSIPTGTITDIGGLIGHNAGSVVDSFAKGSINNIADPLSGQTSNIGGLIGQNAGTVSRTYSSVSFSLSNGTYHSTLGPFIGSSTTGYIYDSSLTIGTPNFNGANNIIVTDYAASDVESGDITIYQDPHRLWTITQDKNAEDSPTSVWILRDLYPELAHSPWDFDERDLAFYKGILGF